MPKHYVTFGRSHAHTIEGKILNRDVVARFEAATLHTNSDSVLKAKQTFILLGRGYQAGKTSPNKYWQLVRQRNNL